MSLSSLVSDGEDGEDGQVDVRESVLTADQSVLTAESPPLFDHCQLCGKPLVWPDSQQRGTCSTRWLHNEDGTP
jgi:hypothetical protein